MFAFVYLKANSMEICDEIPLLSFFGKMLMSAFLLRFRLIIVWLSQCFFVVLPGSKNLEFSRHRP